MALRRFKVDKLVRDKLPEILNKKGTFLHTKQISAEEYIFYLKAKLVEEAREAQQAGSYKELIEELADVGEVIQALCKVSDIRPDQVAEQQKIKRNERGGFDNKVYSMYMDMDEASPSYAHYKSRPHEYPEIEYKE